MRPAPAAILLTVALAHWGLVDPVRARAEAAAKPCTRAAEITPRANGTIPGNAPALVFRAPQIVPARVIEDFQLELRGPGDTLLPFTIEKEGDDLYLLRPGVPLAPGRHVLRYREYCYSGGLGQLDHAFTVTAPSALPTTIGTLAVEGGTTGASPTCTPYAAAGLADIAPSAELQAYRALVRVRLSWQGRVVTDDYGASAGAAGAADHLRMALPIVCLPSQQSVSGRLEIGVHVAGASSDPPPLGQDPVSITRPYAPEKVPPCLADAGMPTEPPNLPDGAADAPLGDGGPIDAAPQDASQTADAPSSPLDSFATGDSARTRDGQRLSGAGCDCALSQEGHTPTSTWAWLLLLLAIGRRALRSARLRQRRDRVN